MLVTLHIVIQECIIQHYTLVFVETTLSVSPMQRDGTVPGIHPLLIFLENYPSFSQQCHRRHFSRSLNPMEVLPRVLLHLVYLLQEQADRLSAVGCSLREGVV